MAGLYQFTNVEDVGVSDTALTKEIEISCICYCKKYRFCKKGKNSSAVYQEDLIWKSGKGRLRELKGYKQVELMRRAKNSSVYTYNKWPTNFYDDQLNYDWEPDHLKLMVGGNSGMYRKRN